MFHLANKLAKLYSDETLMPLLIILKEAAQKENEY